MAKHKNGKKLDYFEAFEKQAELAIAEAKLLVEVVENYKGPDSLDDYIERAAWKSSTRAISSCIRYSTRLRSTS